jgi:asparagine synthase (glutamine-hydrolysing)
MSSLFVLVSDQPGPVPDSLSSIMKEHDAQGGYRLAGVADGRFLPEGAASSMLSDMSASNVVLQFSRSAPHQPGPETGIFIDAPTCRPDLLTGIHRFVSSDLTQDPPSSLFGVFASDGPNGVVIGRDGLGTRPIFRGENRALAYASEPRLLEMTGFGGIEAVRPGTVVDAQTQDKLQLTSPVTEQPDPSTTDLGRMEQELRLAIEAVPAPRAVFFSGGINSLILAKISGESGETVLVTAGMRESKDLKRAQSAAIALDSVLETVEIGVSDIQSALEILPSVTRERNLINLSVSLPILLAARRCRQMGIEYGISGQGADELFGGYHRYLSDDAPEESMRRDLLGLHARGMTAFDLAARSQGVETILPYLDQRFLRHALGVPIRSKISGRRRKVILRQLGLELGIPGRLVRAKKTAIQYGSGVNKYVKKIYRRSRA